MNNDVRNITRTVGGHPVEYVKTVQNKFGTRHLFVSDAFINNDTPTQAFWYNDDGLLLSNCDHSVSNVPCLHLEVSKNPMLLQECVALVYLEMEEA
jgi:hypothetical protein